MGMAASQARLLTLTARIHDVEYEAQALQNAKIDLSTQSDYIYQDYLKALDATTLTVLQMDDAGNKSDVTATFNNLCSLNKVKTANGKGYAIFDERGRLIVDDSVYNAYQEFKEKFGTVKSFTEDYNNGITYAMYTMGIDVSNPKTSGTGTSLFNIEEEVYNNLASGKSSDSALVKAYNNVVDILKTLNKNYNNSLNEDSLTPWCTNGILNKENVKTEDKQNYLNALLTFRAQLYQADDNQIYNKAVEKGMTNDNYTGKDFDYSTFIYYVSMFSQIEQAGGCVKISEFDCEDANSNAATNSEWLKAMIESGKFTMSQVTINSKTGEVSFNTTSPNSDDVISYTPTTQIDKTALAKAEAEYEHKMSIINKKDERFDLELSKLEAERTALTTEYDSVKKVIEDNIDRTFGIFS